jgi:hypothetical protein
MTTRSLCEFNVRATSVETSPKANCELRLLGEYKPCPPADSTDKSGHYLRLSRGGHQMWRHV